MRTKSIIGILIIILSFLISFMSISQCYFISDYLFAFEALIASIIGIFGLKLLNKDIKHAGIYFLISGVGIFFGSDVSTKFLAFITCLLTAFLLILIYNEYKSGNNSENTTNSEKEHDKIIKGSIIIIISFLILASLTIYFENEYEYNYHSNYALHDTNSYHDNEYSEDIHDNNSSSNNNIHYYSKDNQDEEEFLTGNMYHDYNRERYNIYNDSYTERF